MMPMVKLNAGELRHDTEDLRWHRQRYTDDEREELLTAPCSAPIYPVSFVPKVPLGYWPAVIL